MAEKYNFQNPYTYAANNPIKYIDFMGLGPLTDYELNKKGEISKVEGTETNEGPDRLIKGKARYNRKTGELKSRNVISVEKGSFDNLESGKSSQSFSTASGENADKIFNFIAGDSRVEHDKISVTNGSGEKETHFFTSYDSHKVEGGTEYVQNLFSSDSKLELNDITHNHPLSVLDDRESSPNPSGSDKYKAAILTQDPKYGGKQRNLPTFHILFKGKPYPYEQRGPGQKKP